MNVGIVSQWRNQGQATLSRHLRDALETLGHRSHVLARPTRDTHVAPRAIADGDVWRQERVTEASGFQIPKREYHEWVRGNDIRAVFFNQNYQFGAVRRLRESGVRTIGYFVWESFRRADVERARGAYDVVYSLNRCTQTRYRTLGLPSPLVRWGCHPELLAVSAPKRSDGVWYFFPGGLVGPRKPLARTVEAFRRSRRADLRLLVKTQGDGRLAEHVDAGGDPRIVRVADDLPQRAYYDLFASCHVCLGPSRWEGTGLHLFEAIAFGMPVITNDVPPMNELVVGGRNGRLVRSVQTGTAKSGIPSYDPDVDDLGAAIEELADETVRAKLAAGAAAARREMPWEHTLRDLEALLAGSGRTGGAAS